MQGEPHPADVPDAEAIVMAYLAESLARVDGRTQECERRLAALECRRGRLADAVGPGDEQRLRADAIALMSRMARTRLAASLLESYAEMRRDRLAASSGPDQRTTTEMP